jgi:hypothetical protein
MSGITTTIPTEFWTSLLTIMWWILIFRGFAWLMHGSAAIIRAMARIK